MTEVPFITSKFCNRFYVQVTAATVRLTFCEQINQQQAPQAAITLVLSDALELRDLLNRVLPEHKPN